MGGRYMLTGTQLAIMKANAVENKPREVLRVLMKIEHHQFVKDSKKSIKDSLDMMRMVDI